jgi:hypothetical protein
MRKYYIVSALKVVIAVFGIGGSLQVEEQDLCMTKTT